MVVPVNLENYLITGKDAGNRALKISFMKPDTGKVEYFTIATVIAPAPASKIHLDSAPRPASKEGEKMPVENKLHVRIKSKSLPSDQQNSYYYVGAYASDKEKRLQPTGETQDKYNNKIHIITTLTGLALAAWESGKEEVIVPYSGGLPIEEFKKIGGEKALDIFLGEHEVEAIDGEHEGKTVKIKIEDGKVHVEGVTSSLALYFDIKNGELVETELSKTLGDVFAIGDLGAGTFDEALYDENGLNQTISDSPTIGTNPYIDKIIHEIRELPDFEAVRKAVESAENKEDKMPYRTREEFMQKVIQPVVEKMIDTDAKGETEYKPVFIADWMWVEDIDVTEIVLKHMKEYTDAIITEINKFWAKSPQLKKFVLVGGGLLFGYWFLREEKNRLIFPPNLKEAAYFTSRAYLIANYLEQLEKQTA